MARKKVYIVKSGTLNKSTNQYWFTPSYWSSKKRAMQEFESILKINRAKDAHENEEWVKVDDHCLREVTYTGEEGKYRGRIIVEWSWLDPHYN
jgi:hypothetical protein